MGELKEWTLGRLTCLLLLYLVLTRLFLPSPLGLILGRDSNFSRCLVRMFSSLASCFGHFDAACLTTFDIIAVDNKAGVSGWSDETQGS